MNTFNLTISSPDGTLFNGEAVKLVLRGAGGELAVMASHAPFITSVQQCDCRVELDDSTEKVGHTDGGLLTVAANKVTLLSGSFVWKNE